jgi:Na+-driven multidrug efflux pump
VGFPEWGIAGAAWATVISGFIPPVCLGLLYFSRRLDAEYRTRRFCGLTAIFSAA